MYFDNQSTGKQVVFLFTSQCFPKEIKLFSIFLLSYRNICERLVHVELEKAAERLASCSLSQTSIFFYNLPGVSIKFEEGSWLEKKNRLYEQGAVRNLSLIT